MKVVWMAWFALLEHVGSGRVAVELLFTAAFTGALWLGAMPVPLFFLALNLFGLAMGALVSFRLTAWANQSRGYLLVVRPLGRGGYLWGIVLASWVLAFAAYLVPLVTVGLHMGLTRWEVAGGALPLLPALGLVVAGMTFLSPLVLGSEWWRTLFLMLVALSVYREELGQWSPVLGRGLKVLWLAVTLPVVSALRLSMEPAYDLAALWLVLIVAAEAGLFLAAAFVLFAQRQLDWE